MQNNEEEFVYEPLPNSQTKSKEDAPKYQHCIRDGCINWFKPPPGVRQLYCCRKCRKLDRKEAKQAGLLGREMINQKREKRNV